MNDIEKAISHLGLLRYDCMYSGNKETVKLYDLAISALEKQLPKKPLELADIYPDSQFDCPVCGIHVGYPTFRNTPFGEMRIGEHKMDYCWNCGQKIDWSGDDE